MKDLFQRRGRPGTETGTLRLTLGAFGKHPGWDDHILGIGVETETLAQLKQTLYVGGIGAQIDSGAWEKLEAEKRLAGFDHTFLCQRPGHVLLGQLWSSTDGKGRAKYPMVLCIDGEGVSPGFMLRSLSGGLERLRSACKSTTSADQVARDCHSAQDQLRSTLGQDPSRLNDPGITPDSRRRFIEHPKLGPDRLGFLRALHELKAAPALTGNDRGPAANTVRSLRSSHLRLPIGADSAKDGILLWTNLLRCILPDAVPLLMIARAEVDWLDVLINEPAPDDFFCLQAGPKALPLATEIPYQLAPDLTQRWTELEAKFLGIEPALATKPVQSPVPPPAPRPFAPPPPPPSVPAYPAPTQKFDRTAPVPSATTIGATERRGSKLPLLAIVAVVVILAIAAVWFFTRGPHKPTAQSGGPVDLAQNPTTAASSAANDVVRLEQSYQAAMTAARAAQESKDYQTAIRQAELALKSKAGDPEATKLLEQSKQAAAVALEQEQKYQAATNAAAQALVQMNYHEATNRIASALAVKPGDPVAVKLMNEAQQALNAGAQQQKYQSAIESAKTAFTAANFKEAVNQARVALAIKPSDPVATSLLTDSRAKLDVQTAVMQQFQQYQSATNAAATALFQSNYQTAANQAKMALTLRTNDPVALALKAQAETGLALANAQGSFAQGDYAKAAAICRSRATNDAFAALATTVASEQKALADAGANFNSGDYAQVQALKNQSYSTKTPFAQLISQATQENAVLTSLQSIKQTNGWQELQTRLTSSDNANLRAKPPFAELLNWANAQAAAPVSTQTTASATAQVSSPANTPDQTVRRLDTKLEVLLVQFEVLKPTARELKTDEARRTKPLPDGVIDTGYYLGQVDTIEGGLKQGGWLDQDNRKIYIDKLRKAINVR